MKIREKKRLAKKREKQRDQLETDFVITIHANSSRRLDSIIANRKGKAADIFQFWHFFMSHSFSEFMQVTRTNVQMKKPPEGGS